MNPQTKLFQLASILQNADLLLNRNLEFQSPETQARFAVAAMELQTALNEMQKLIFTELELQDKEAV